MSRTCRLRQPRGLPALALACTAALSLVATPAQAQSGATGTTFAANSLIIPMSSSWQDACGVVSAYGLIYDVLRANDGLVPYPAAADQKFTTPIMVHWVYSTTKSSPNRCIPTNQSVLYNGGTKMAQQANTPGDATTGHNPSSNGGVWNDGCDFEVDRSVDTTGVPVTQVITTDKTLQLADAVATTLDTSGSTEYPAGVGQALAFPNFVATQVKTTTGVSIARYGGGSFVITGSDVTQFLTLLSGKEVHKDSLGNNVDFSLFTTSTGGTPTSNTTKTHACSIALASQSGNSLAAFNTWDNNTGFGSAGTTAGGGNQLAYANEHYVTVHRALVAFTANDTQHWNTRPPRIGLLQTVAGLFNPEGDATPTTGIKGAQLKYYLKSAGLDFNGASGCPEGGFNTTTAVFNNETSTTNIQAFCPNGGTPGQVYDYLDAIDVANGLLDNYRIFWAPHFQQPCFSASATGCGATPYCCAGKASCGAACPASVPIPTACIASPFSSSNDCVAAAERQIGTFLGEQNRGFFGECATIATFEGSFSNNDPGINSQLNFISLDGGTTQTLTCVNNGTGGCSTTSTKPGLSINYTDARSVRLDTCDNPVQPSDDTHTASFCIAYTPTSDFAQIGDFRWYSYSGGTENYVPASDAGTQGTNSIYTSGTVRLAYTVKNGNSYVDNFSLAQQTANTAAVVYLAGHNYTSDVAGTRVALNTVLALGLSVSTSETGFVGATLYKGDVFVPTYYEVTTSRPPDSWQTYNPSTGSQWHFPYHTGELRAHALAAATSTQNYGDAVVWSASDGFVHTQAVSGGTLQDSISNTPSNRNLFTYLGGAVTTTGVPAGIPNQIAQKGWMPVNFDETQITNTSSCLDNFHVGPVGPVAATHKPGYAGMVSGTYAGGAHVCDLQEALELNVPLAALGTDYGASEQSQILGDLTDGGQINSAVQLVRMVRGYCFGTQSTVDGTTAPVASAGSACNNQVQYGGPVVTGVGTSTVTGSPTLDYLGGFVHSQVAVIPDTPFVTNANGKMRPTVAYIGGLDGQLHAFYVPRGDNLESGYTGPSVAPVALTSSAASTVFPTSYAGGFNASTHPLAELWSFIPPGQLPFLATNQAQVDSSPAVIDVYGDFAGTGIRTWHTELVASAGGSNRELFALDVTNPLSPILLWDLQSSYSSAIPYAPVPLTDDDTGLNTSTSDQATRWNNTCRAAQEVPLADGGIPCTPAKYVLPSSLDPGATPTGVYNYQHLGASQSVSVAAMRRNGQPLFAAFVATNEPAGNGIYVFAIDLVTGQKLWEWSSPYDKANMPASQSSGVGNTSPAGVTLLSKAGNALIDTVYVGDDAGNLWELDAQDGVSLTAYGAALSCTNGACNYALSEAYGAGNNGPQPISTLSTLFFIPSTTPSTSAFAPFIGQTLLAYGTGGTDTVSGLSSVPNGAIHVIPVGASGRYQAADILANSALRTTVSTSGVAKEATGYPQYLLNSQRIFGSISATNDKLYFSGTQGTVSGLDSRGSAALQGTTYALSVNAGSAASALSSIASGSGGVGGSSAVDTSVAGQVTVVTITGQKIVTTVDKSTNSVASEHSINNLGLTPTGLLGWIVRQSGHDY